jgi:predicted RNA-binding Zn-ribbon protein involved in translation (DUF1610 family)
MDLAKGPSDIGPFAFVELAMSQIPFVCPNCGGDKFRVSSEPKDLDDMIGAPCASCGTPLTEEEVKRQAHKIAIESAKKVFGKSGTTRITFKI